MDSLGSRIGAEIVTREHRDVSRIAEDCGVAYKVSGAGGGDLGLAFGGDSSALERFKKIAGEDFDVMEFAIDTMGLRVETTAE